MQQAFGTVGKPLQVGFAADAGVRAARLAQAGARCDLHVVDEWLTKVNPTAPVDVSGAAISGSLAIKLFPCCYAMQRPIGVMRAIGARLASDGTTVGEITAIRVTTPAKTVVPLIHSCPETGLEGKFSLEYSLATALLDGFPNFGSFTDAAVQRPDAQSIVRLVTANLTDEPVDNLLSGDCTIEVELASGETLTESLTLPPGSPGLPPTAEELAAKIAACGEDVPGLLANISWA